jgi:hypothetical protein
MVHSVLGRALPIGACISRWDEGAQRMWAWRHKLAGGTVGPGACRISSGVANPAGTSRGPGSGPIAYPRTCRISRCLCWQRGAPAGLSTFYSRPSKAWRNPQICKPLPPEQVSQIFITQLPWRRCAPKARMKLLPYWRKPRHADGGMLPGLNEIQSCAASSIILGYSISVARFVDLPQ